MRPAAAREEIHDPQCCILYGSSARRLNKKIKNVCHYATVIPTACLFNLLLWRRFGGTNNVGLARCAVQNSFHIASAHRASLRLHTKCQWGNSVPARIVRLRNGSAWLFCSWMQGCAEECLNVKSVHESWETWILTKPDIGERMSERYVFTSSTSGSYSIAALTLGLRPLRIHDELLHRFDETKMYGLCMYVLCLSSNFDMKWHVTCLTRLCSVKHTGRQ